MIVFFYWWTIGQPSLILITCLVYQGGWSSSPWTALEQNWRDCGPTLPLHMEHLGPCKSSRWGWFFILFIMIICIFTDAIMMLVETCFPVWAPRPALPPPPPNLLHHHLNAAMMMRMMMIMIMTMMIESMTVMLFIMNEWMMINIIIFSPWRLPFPALNLRGLRWLLWCWWCWWWWCWWCWWWWCWCWWWWR